MLFAKNMSKWRKVCMYAVLLLFPSLYSAYFVQDKNVSSCLGLHCHNEGTVGDSTCTCLCSVNYTGLLCEIESIPSAWPDGSYSLLSTVFGCPEPETHGWIHGHVNLTVPDTSSRQWYPERFRLLGPYHLRNIQFNFCTRVMRSGDTGSGTDTWPPGNYCIFKMHDSCPTGFTASDLNIVDYHIWHEDIAGVTPTFNATTGISFTLCCRDNQSDSPIDLPSTFPFYLVKSTAREPCPEVSRMVVTEETFSFAKRENRTWSHNDDVMNIDEDDRYFNLTLCYYEPYERRECWYSEDKGASYRGWVNVTEDGRACQRWDENTFPMANPRYEGDFDDNFCRITWDSWKRPYCVIDESLHYCNIPVCDSSDDLPNIVQGKVFRSAPTREDTPIKHIADGLIGSPPFAVMRPYIEPWVQVDLQEEYEVHSITVYKAYTWMPYSSRRLVTYVSEHQWDFLNFGAYTCDGPYNPAKSSSFRFQCRRPLVGTFVTIQNFVKYNPYRNENQNSYFELSEVVIRGKSTGCGKSLGIKSGSVEDFQMTSSTNMAGKYAYHARLNRDTGWCADKNDENPYLQVDLLTPMVVQGVILQGWTEGRTSLIPETFTILYGPHPDNLTVYTDVFGNQKVFSVDQSYVASASQRFLLPARLLTRIVRISFNQSATPICVKLDLIGCPQRVDLDLSCKGESTVMGLQAMPGHSFYQDVYNDTFVLRDVSLDHCITNYLAHRDVYASYRHSAPDQLCTYLLGNRYSRHNQHWWITGLSAASQYGQAICLKEISNPATCGGEINVGGEVISPSYPLYYGENINCTWQIRLEPGTFVILDLVDVNLAGKEEQYDSTAYQDCEDALFIYDRNRDGDPLISRITGYPFDSLEGPSYISSSNEMEINLVSCHRVRQAAVRGFNIKVGAVECGGCGQGENSCSRTPICRAECGYITSPGFPGFYPESTSCTWRIQGRMGQYVAVTFDMSDVIAEPKCQGDHVTLYDLDLAEERSLLGKYCKNERSIGEMKSSWHMMDVEFYSDFYTSGRGFRLKYSLRAIELSARHLEQTGNCDNSSIGFDQNCYRFLTASTGLSWFEAEHDCSRNGGHLVSINSPEEMMFLHSTIVNQHIFSRQEIYIGLRKYGSESFKWTDGNPLTHTEWYGGDLATGGQPDGFDQESCTMMKISSIRSTQNWHDVACAFDQVNQYICEVDNTSMSEEVTISTERVGSNSTYFHNGYYFRCTGGDFISRLFLCNGNQDCKDGSDEINCPKGSCPSESFTCNSGQCVDMAFLCDHTHHCLDRSDEAHCVFPECGSDQWQCSSGQCVSTQKRCDLLQDCVDGTDELDCESCPASYFQCYDGGCLPPGRVCDGFVDCGGQYREDEGPQCTTNSQLSCTAWYALGARDSGKYNINIQGETDSHAVECVFDVESEMISTIIHHNMEDLTVIGNTKHEENIEYTVPGDITAYVVNTSSTCRQRVTFDCLQSYDHYHDDNTHWYDVNGKKQTFLAESGSNCSCILDDVCNETNHKCACDQTRAEYFLLEDNDWVTDSGYVTDMRSLPITKVFIADMLRLSRVRHSIGPLVCEQRAETGTRSLLCKSGVVVDISHICLLDYDIYDHHTGCRDLTHLENCESFQCPANHIKCPSSYCVPFRRVCDGHLDCVGGSDERNCANSTCDGLFRCHGTDVCIPWQQVCDDIKHCPEEDDEYFCDNNCPGNCTCSGASVECIDFQLDNSDLVPLQTRLLKIRTSPNTTLTNHTFSHLYSLSTLDLSHVGLNELEQHSFSGLDNLLHLDLSMNSIDIIAPGLFFSLRSLKHLSLIGNPISQIFPGSFDGLAVLPRLDLSNMKIGHIVTNTFDGLSSLVSLNISGNVISSVQDAAFTGADKIDTLDLSDNSITSFGGGMFTGLNDLAFMYNDRYVFCCLRPASVKREHCFPQTDEFSSCSDLMRNSALRISMWVLGFIALAGNIVVLLSRCIYDRQSLRRSNDFFVANLALSDFFMGVYMVIIASADASFRGIYSWNDETWRGSWMCQMAGFLATLSAETSVMFLCMITLERMLVIKFPFRELNFIKKSSGRICFIVWLIGLIFAGTPLMPLSYFSGSFYSRSGVCLALPLTRDRPSGWEYSTAIFVVWNCVCFVFIALGQAVIYHTVKSSQRLRQGRTSNDMAIARKLSIIVISDFVCWFPICVMGLMSLRGHAIGSEVYAWVAVFVLPINSALNPVIYTLSSIDTVRKRKLSKSNLSMRDRGSSTIQSTASNKPTVAQLLQSQSICLTPPENSVALTSHLSTLKSSLDIVTIAEKLVESLVRLHTASLISGEVHSDSLYVIFKHEEVNNVVISCVPMATTSDEDFSQDILDFGHVVSKMLRAHTVGKLRRVKF